MCQAIIEMIEEGREEGRSEGMETGRYEGIQMGHSMGIEEIIMVMLRKGYDCTLISQMTDISIDIINKLAEESVN